MSKVERNCYGGLLKIFDYSILPGYIKYLSVGELCIFIFGISDRYMPEKINRKIAQKRPVDFDM